MDEKIFSDKTAENALIRSLLIRPEIIPEIKESLLPSHFYQEHAQSVVSAIYALHEAQQPIDPLTVVDQVQKQKQEHLLPAGYMLDLMLEDAYATSLNAESYARIIYKQWFRRDRSQALQRMAAAIYDDALGPEELQSEIENNADCLPINSKQTPHVSTALQEVFDNIDKAQRGENEKPISTGIIAIDRISNICRKGELVIWAARPGVGKTTGALVVALNIALQSIPVAFLSLEMSAKSLGTKLLASQARVNSSKIASGEVNEEEMTRLIESGNDINQCPLYIEDDTTSIATLDAIKRKITQLVRVRNTRVVIVDYLQLLTDETSSKQNFKNREQEVSKISRELKLLAMRLGITIIAVCQLSRALEGRADKRPILSDLRESGALEQNAGIVVFLYREDYYTEGPKTNIAEINIEKDREGPTGTAMAYYNGEFSLFADLTVERYDTTTHTFTSKSADALTNQATTIDTGTSYQPEPEDE